MHKTDGKGVTEIPATPFAFIWFAIKPYKKWFFLAVLFVSLSDLFGGLQSYTFKGFVDSANFYTSGGGSIRIVFLWVLIYPILILLAAVAIRATGFMLNYLTVYTRTRSLKILFEYLSLHSQSYFNDRFSGALSEKANTVAQNASRLLDQFIWNILSLFTDFLVTTVIIFFVNKTIALAFVCGFAILIPINWLLTRSQANLSAQRAELIAKLRGQVIDVVTNITAVQQYARRFYEIIRLDKSVIEYREADLKRNNYREWVLAINNILVGTFIGVIILWGFWVWSKGGMTIGALVMIVALTRGFMRDLTHVGQNLNNIMEAYGEMQNGLKEIVRPHDIIDKPNARKLVIETGEVTFGDAMFAYDKDPRNIFEKLSFTVKGGEKVGIVGGSGAGKTTLMKLLLRQHDLVGGGISIDEQDIREVTQESLRESISVVPQEPMLFHRTIRENIMYGKLDASDYEMIEVAKKAQAHDFIEQLPQKYDSLVGERGVKLSVGQRQRIAIARAFLKNAPILILDEATSALDSESEVAVQKALQALMEGKTVFAIAHRLSTLRDMDRILVFKDGRIVEDGKHRALIKNKDGVYASFWSHQAGGFIKED
ncbi:MAG: ABC transporter ATP-binding protein [Minisyncoccia bacterium]